jgi:hypothetical protein
MDQILYFPDRKKNSGALEMKRKGVFTLIIHKFTSSYSRISRQKKISHFFQLLFKFMLVQKTARKLDQLIVASFLISLCLLVCSWNAEQLRLVEFYCFCKYLEFLLEQKNQS